jgi:hypothetical protein
MEDAMPVQEVGKLDGAELEQVVERQIVQRTWGRIHRLAVEVRDDRLIVHGCTASYYAKQLALQAALEVLDSTDATCVELDIQVGDPRRFATRSASQQWADA